MHHIKWIFITNPCCLYPSIAYTKPYYMQGKGVVHRTSQHDRPEPDLDPVMSRVPLVPWTTVAAQNVKT